MAVLKHIIQSDEEYKNAHHYFRNARKERAEMLKQPAQPTLYVLIHVNGKCGRQGEKSADALQGITHAARKVDCTAIQGERGIQLCRFLKNLHAYKSEGHDNDDKDGEGRREAPRERFSPRDGERLSMNRPKTVAKIIARISA